LVIVIAVLAVPVSGAGAATLLRLNGIGPLKLGMTRADAVATGWLAQRQTGCPLGGPPLPITYRLTGANAPSGIRGTAEFTGGRLRNLSFTRGVRTAAGVRVRHTTIAGMVRRYKDAGFKARAEHSDVFGGSFVTVKRGKRSVIGGFGEGSRVTILALRHVPVCE
jgi:hypothetical protein